jgi:hypothetical protein
MEYLFMDAKIRKYIEEFRDLRINRKQLYDLVKTEQAERITVYNRHLIYVLEEYIKGNIDQERLLEWVNTIWFSELYKYDESERECIGNIISELEELDERTNPLSIDEARHYILALRKNEKL